MVQLPPETTLEQLSAQIGQGRLHAGFFVHPGSSERLLRCLDAQTADSCDGGGGGGDNDTSTSVSAPPPQPPPLPAAPQKDAAPGGGYSAQSAITFLFDEGRGGIQLVSALRGLNADMMAWASVLTGRGALGEAARLGLPASRLNAAAVVFPVNSTTVRLHLVNEPGAHTATGLSFIDYWVRRDARKRASERAALILAFNAPLQSHMFGHHVGKGIESRCSFRLKRWRLRPLLGFSLVRR